MEPIRVVHVGVCLFEHGDWNGQILYHLTNGVLEVSQDERIPFHPAKNLSDADRLTLAEAIEIGDLD